MESPSHIPADEIIPADSTGGQVEGPTASGGRPLSLRQQVGLVLGPLLFLALVFWGGPADLPTAGRMVIASVAWIATWWISEAIPIAVTSLLPLVLFPLTGALSIQAAAAPYANPNVFLFLGGFIIAVCIERHGLHRRLALTIIAAVGTSPSRLILGFMASTAFLSMWISNTATTMMITPIGLAVILELARLIQAEGIEGIDVRQGQFAFGTCLMLSIAYSASIGGIATLIGTPPNIVFAGIAQEMFGVSIGFGQWMAYGLPISLVMLVVAWLYMTRVAYPSKLRHLPGGRELMRGQLRELGPMSRAEKAVAAIFGGVALAWITRSLFLEAVFPMLTDAGIAVIGAVVTFLVPVDLRRGEFLNDWETASRLPWGILLLFGGGLSLAGAVQQTGLADWLGARLAVLQGLPPLLVLLAVIGAVIFLTEMTSNIATTSMTLPIMAAMAAGMGIHPFLLMIGTATAASCAFMLPVATPPNAVVFSSGYVTIPEMAKAGLALNLISIVLITLAARYWLPLVWGISW